MNRMPPNAPSGDREDDDRDVGAAPYRHGQPGVPPEPRDPAGPAGDDTEKTPA